MQRNIAGASLALAFALAAASATIAAAAPSVAPTVTVCANRKTGALRQAHACTHDEKTYKIGEVGPQGPAGPVGPVGPVGPTGAAGIAGPTGPATLRVGGTSNEYVLPSQASTFYTVGSIKLAAGTYYVSANFDVTNKGMASDQVECFAEGQSGDNATAQGIVPVAGNYGYAAASFFGAITLPQASGIDILCTHNNSSDSGVDIVDASIMAITVNELTGS